MWPTYIGEFYNPNHLEIKKPLLDFFTQYKNLNKNSRSGGTVLSPTDKSSEDKYEINDDVYMSKYDLHLMSFLFAHHLPPLCPLLIDECFLRN